MESINKLSSNFFNKSRPKAPSVKSDTRAIKWSREVRKGKKSPVVKVVPKKS